MSKGTATVKAKAKGFHIGPREPGDIFQMPLKADGTPMKGSWFDVVGIDKDEPAQGETKQPVKAGGTVLTDEESLA